MREEETINLQEVWGKREEEAGSPCWGWGPCCPCPRWGRAGWPCVAPGSQLAVGHSGGCLARSQTSAGSQWWHSRGVLWISQVRGEVFGAAQRGQGWVWCRVRLHLPACALSPWPHCWCHPAQPSCHGSSAKGQSWLGILPSCSTKSSSVFPTHNLNLHAFSPSHEFGRCLQSISDLKSKQQYSPTYFQS